MERCDRDGRDGDAPRVAGVGLGNVARLALMLGIAGLFAVAFWARVSSIETAPLPDGDEAWYGVQVEHLLQGKPFAVRTGNGNPLNPFHSGLQVPLLWAFPPSFWILRVPAVLAGVLAVVLMYVLMARVLDRTTALIAAGLLAAMPVAVFYSRVGYDVSQTPLFNVLAFYYAFKGHRGGLLLAFLACWLSHPTNLFLLPMLATVFLVQRLRRHPGDPARGLRSAMVTLAVVGAVTLAVGVPAFRRHAPQATPGQAVGGRFQFFVDFAKLHLCLGYYPSPFPSVDLSARIFWGVVVGALVLGSALLIRRRQWDRLALVGGVIAGVAAFRLATRPGIIDNASARYGLFLVVPTILALSCLLRSLIVAPAGGWRRAARGLQFATLLAAGWALMLGVYVNLLREAAGPGESLRTFRVDEPNPFAVVLSVLEDDLARAQPSRRVVVANDWWTSRPLQFLASGRRDLRVVRFREIGGVVGKTPGELRKHLNAGGYALGYAGQPLGEIARASYPPGSLRSWTVFREGQPFLVLSRLREARDEGAPPSIALNASSGAGGARR